MELMDYGQLDGDLAVDWRTAVDRFRDYLDDREDVAVVFENQETGDRSVGSSPHRFDPQYSDKQYAKLKDLERGLRRRYGKRLHTAMLTFTGSSQPDEEPLPPVDHLDDLLASWEAVRRALARQMDGRRFERLAILEPHKSGYIHVHMAVFVDGVVTREELAPVIEAHLRNCEIAGRDAHDLSDDSTISIKHVGADRSEGTIENLGTYLAEYLGAYDGDSRDAPEHVQMSDALLWATNRQRWRPSNGAQEFMKLDRERPDESPWEVVAIMDGDEERPASPEGGGVRRFRTRWLETDSSSKPPPAFW